MKKTQLSKKDLWVYASGEGATSITMNGIGNFAMLFYAQIMGLSPELAGIALSISTVWDALTDPVMGTISDRTSTRYGRRHPYMLIGGVLLALGFLALWFVPKGVRGEKVLFGYLLTINILIKTAFTVFVVPYTALGFEMCKMDADRSRLQGVRYGFNMVVNVIFGAFAWVLFFKDGVAADGSRLDGTKIGANFRNMGAVLTVSALAMILLCVFATYQYAEKGMVKRGKERFREHVKAFLHDLKDVYSDRLVWIVFGFFGLAQFSMMVVSQVQMFTYVDYMQFTDYQKTFVHMSGMVAFMLGSLALSGLVKRLDKKKTGYLAMVISAVGGLGALAVFTGGVLTPQAAVGGFPLAVAVFGLLQMLWWGGCGIIVPLATSMIADLSEVKKWETGEVTEGRYAAGLSFFLKAANALGLFVTGYILKSVGYVSGAEAQGVKTVNNLALMTFITGPILMGLSFFILRIYPTSRQIMCELREKYGRDAEE